MNWQNRLIAICCMYTLPFFTLGGGALGDGNVDAKNRASAPSTVNGSEASKSDGFNFKAWALSPKNSTNFRNDGDFAAGAKPRGAKAHPSSAPEALWQESLSAKHGSDNRILHAPVNPFVVMSYSVDDHIELPLQRLFSHAVVRPKERSILSAVGESVGRSNVELVGGGSCDAFESRSFGVKHELSFWRISTEGRKCRDAVQELESLSLMMDSYTEKGRGLLLQERYICEIANSNLKGTVQRYAEACIDRLTDVKDYQIALNERDIQTTMMSLGVISGDNYERKCIGVVSDGLVVTASHCFGYEIDGLTGKLLIEFPSGNFYFNSFAGKSYRLSASGELNGKVIDLESRPEDDWLAIPFSSEEILLPPGVPFAPDLATFERSVTIIAPSQYLTALEVCRNDWKKPELLDSLSIDLRPGCRILAREGDIVYHGCQTVSGMSGAPLLTVESGRVYFLAVHSGASMGLRTQCAKDYAPRLPNYAVVPKRKY